MPRAFAFVGFLALATLLASCDALVSTEAPAAGGLFDDDPVFAAAPGGDWQWVPTAGMRCRDGSATGFGLRRAPDSRNLLFVLDGGGACFDLLTCLLNPNSYDEADFNADVAELGTVGVFDQSRPENPFRDWNIVFVPYCTGDIHAGNAPNTFIFGLGRQDFVGLRNMNAILQRIGGLAQRADHVVLSGGSAGGFGAVGTYGLVSERLAPAPVDLLDDSGPVPPDDDVLSPDLQARWYDLWNLDTALPDGCTDCGAPDGLQNVLPYYASTNPDRTFGLLSYRQDAVIRFFFGGVGGQAFEDGLFGIRPTLPSNAGTYYVPGDAHTFIADPAFYTTTVEGVALTDWIADLLAGQVTDVPAVPLRAAPAPLARP